MELRGNLLLSYYDHPKNMTKNLESVARTVELKEASEIKTLVGFAYLWQE